MRRRSRSAVLGLLALVVLGTFGLTGCGADEGRTALAVTSTHWVGANQLAVTVECAHLGTAKVDPGKGVDGIPLLTVWGEPKVGRCATNLVVELPAGTERIDDAATGMVVDLPTQP